MMNFRAELLTEGSQVDYMEFESRSLESARSYAHVRFAQAYPHITGQIKVKAILPEDIDGRRVRINEDVSGVDGGKTGTVIMELENAEGKRAFYIELDEDVNENLISIYESAFFEGEFTFITEERKI